MPHHAYTIPHEDPALTGWRCEDPDALATAFSIAQTRITVARPFVVENDIVQWHTLMAALPEKQWRILRRCYAIHTTKFRSYTAEELVPLPALDVLATTLGVSVSDVHAAHTSALARWSGAARTPDTGPALDDNQALAAFAFNHPAILADERQRTHLAKRIRELLPALQTADSRAQGRSMLETERQLIFIVEPGIEDLRADMKNITTILLTADAEAATGLYKAKASLNEELEKMLKRHGEMQKVILTASDALGLAEMQSVGGAEKLTYHRTLSDLAEACRLYHMDGDRTLIDQMNAADEIVILTTPYLDRPAQYRPDLVLNMPEIRAQLFTGLELALPGRAFVKRLTEGFKHGLGMALEESGFEAVPLDDTGAVENEEQPAMEPHQFPTHPAAPTPPPADEDIE